MRALAALALALLLAGPAHADTTVYSIVTSSTSSGSSPDVLKGVGLNVDEDLIVDQFEPYFTTSGAYVRFAIWRNTSGSSWTVIWDQDVYVSSTGYTAATPQIALSAGETYLFGYWIDSTMGYHWSSYAQPDPAWGTTDGRVTYDQSAFPSTFTRSYDSAVGGYRMQITATTTTDADLDGYEGDVDCDDSDPDTYPGAAELCDGVDNDCDGLLPPDEQDADFDTWPSCLGDCDDYDGSVWPGAPEQCDGLDNDCDLGVDEGLTFDADADGFTSLFSCSGSADDCDDDDPAVRPDAAEVCDFLDNDCDGVVDEDFEYDGDNDFFTNDACGGDDCDDQNPATFPGAVEQCDGEDNDCDGASPADELVDEDSDGEPACTDCDDGDPDVHPGQIEDCSNGIDDNCNGEIDESGDVDGDGFGACDDCDDDDPDVHPDAAEDECNGVDDDCDGDLHPLEEDDDGDGWRGCEDDCDDDNDAVYPGADEVCDGVDNDCDGALHPEEGEENDADGDGIPICFDCDDEDPAVHPGAEEDPCVEIDADCDGEVPDLSECGDDDDGGGGGGGGGRRSAGCGCAAAGGGAGLPLLWALGLRRRRGSQPGSPAI